MLYINQLNVIRLSSKCNSKLVKEYYFWKVFYVSKVAFFSNFWLNLLAKNLFPYAVSFFSLCIILLKGIVCIFLYIKEIDLQLSWITLPLIYLRPPDDLKKGRNDRLLLFLKAEVLSCKNKSIHGKFQVRMIFCSVFFCIN